VRSDPSEGKCLLETYERSYSWQLWEEGEEQNSPEYSYNKTNQMHQFLKFIFGIKLYMFWTVPLSIVRSSSLYTQQWYMSHRFRNSLYIVTMKVKIICQTPELIPVVFSDMTLTLSLATGHPGCLSEEVTSV